MANRDALLFGLDVNVARARGDSSGEQLVDERRDRRAVLFDGGRKRRLLSIVQVLDIDRRLRLAHRTFGAVHLVDAQRDLVRIGERESHVAAGRKAERALAVDVERIGRGDQQLLRGRRQRHDVKAPRPLFRHQRNCLLRCERQVGDGQTESP